MFISVRPGAPLRRGEWKVGANQGAFPAKKTRKSGGRSSLDSGIISFEFNSLYSVLHHGNLRNVTIEAVAAFFASKRRKALRRIMKKASASDDGGPQFKLETAQRRPVPSCLHCSGGSEFFFIQRTVAISVGSLEVFF